MSTTSNATKIMTYADAACAALREAIQADPNVIALGEDHNGLRNQTIPILAMELSKVGDGH